MQVARDHQAGLVPDPEARLQEVRATTLCIDTVDPGRRVVPERQEVDACHPNAVPVGQTGSQPVGREGGG
jgi:hypothetical protein